jgi:hypothetical protein
LAASKEINDMQRIIDVDRTRVRNNQNTSFTPDSPEDMGSAPEEAYDNMPANVRVPNISVTPEPVVTPEPLVPDTVAPVVGAEVAATSSTFVDDKVQAMIADPSKYITDNSLDQRYIPQSLNEEEEIMDKNMNRLGDMDPIEASLTTSPTKLKAAEDVKVTKLTAADAVTAPQMQAAAKVNVDAMVAAGAVKFDAIKAAEDVKVADFSASLIDIKYLTKSVDEIAKTQPMQAASMAKEMDDLLSGMEEGNVPLWARPAVTKVEQMLAGRGISASSIGRDSLFNAIIQSALPMAQQDASFKQDAFKTNYNAKVQAIFTDVNMEFAAKQFNATSINQTNQFRTQLQAQVDNQNAARADGMAQFNTNLKAQIDLDFTARQDAAAKFNTNLDAQLGLDAAARQDSASQFNINLGAQLDLDAAARQDRIAQFNTDAQSRADLSNAARRDATDQFNVQTDVSSQQFNSSQANSMAQMTAQIQSSRDQFNANMATQIEQSNVNWRRQLNTANTAGENAVNQANVQNAFNLSNQGLTFLWQEQRDEAHWDNQASEKEKTRKAEKEIALLMAASEVGVEAGSTLVRMIEGSQMLLDFLG